eukprot:scaffold10.g2329.t1
MSLAIAGCSATLAKLAWVQQCVAAARGWRFLSTAPPDAPPPQQPTYVGLPPEQLAKALLMSNCRAQLMTVAAGATGAEEPKVLSGIVQYLPGAGRGVDLVVLLSPLLHAGHVANLEANPTASLCTGHLNPPGIIQRIRAAGWLPTRITLLGKLAPLPSGEYVDATGKQHDLQPWDVDAALLDPLATSLQEVLLELNDDPEWQGQLRLFCAAYLSAEVSAALVTEADRLGFTLLGQLAGAAAEAAAAGGGGGDTAAAAALRWRQFRFAFQREVRDLDGFWAMLDGMREEVPAAAAAGGRAS